MAVVDMNEAQLETLRALLDSADRLCTAVVSGAPGQMQLALAVAGQLSDLKRRGFLKGVK
jgi:hypothetical protein